MTYIEGIRQEEADKAIRTQQSIADQAALEKERLQREVADNERRAQRRQQAEAFRQESGVGLAIDELVEFLETPTVPVNVIRENDGFVDTCTEYVGRGTRGLPDPITLQQRGQDSVFATAQLPHPITLQQRDPDSLLDTVHWDITGGYKLSPYGIRSTKASYNYISAESCPDGTIVFHGGWFGSTTIRLAEWRTGEKEKIFDNALKKAFYHPRVHRYSVYLKESSSFG